LTENFLGFVSDFSHIVILHVHVPSIINWN